MRAVILLEQQYQDLEFWYPYYRLKEAEYEVVVIAPKTGETYAGKYGYPAEADLAAVDARAEDFDAVIIPGGFAPDYMRRHPVMVEFVKTMGDSGKLVAAICHGVWLPASTGLVEGKRATSFFAIKDDVVNAGGLWEDSEVVRDGNLITSRKPEDLPAFLRTILEALARL